MQDLKDKNYVLTSTLHEQERLISSYTESQILNLNDCEISKIQKVIQGNNYQILYLEKKNLEYRKAILKAVNGKKKSLIRNETRSLYESKFVADAAQVLTRE